MQPIGVATGEGLRFYDRTGATIHHSKQHQDFETHCKTVPCYTIETVLKDKTRSLPTILEGLGAYYPNIFIYVHVCLKTVKQFEFNFGKKSDNLMNRTYIGDSLMQLKMILIFKNNEHSLAHPLLMGHEGQSKTASDTDIKRFFGCLLVYLCKRVSVSLPQTLGSILSVKPETHSKWPTFCFDCIMRTSAVPAGAL